ncbi:polyphenol oxidase family protein [Faecalicoccus acidiformans]|uniref:polyphenol oxidase family protein n=1 Tax=Faecalicoccus acidiformans TaxID=915173 RepID=UPI003209EEC7
MKKITFCQETICGGVTMKDRSRPDQNNMALHVCNDPQGVLENRHQLEKETIPLNRWALAWQKHTDQFYRVTRKDIGKGAYDKDTSILNVDALYTTEPEILIGVFTADCLGILVFDSTTPCVCTIHSGWKGTVQKITYKTIAHLIQKQLIHPQTTQVFFGPSLQFDSLEIGQDVITQIQAMDMNTAPFLKPISEQKALFDNQGLNIQMLRDLGIPSENIHPSSYDTLKDIQDTFSYRMNNRLKEFPKCGEHFIYGYINKKSLNE